MAFAATWLSLLRQVPFVSKNGWYDPPPMGLSVLAATDQDLGRNRFRSLRDPAYWPSARVIDWVSGVLYAYCSPVDLNSGLMGDFAITLYFGNRPKIVDHFRKAHDATARVLECLRPGMSSRELFLHSQVVFTEAGLNNSVHSITDATPVDLGHTLVSHNGLCHDAHGNITPAIKTSLSTRRQFVNATDDWQLTPGLPFTIEPQLVSSSQGDLPKVSFHYLVTIEKDNAVTILMESDHYWKEFGLL